MQEKVLELAAKSSPATLAAHLYPHAEQLLQAGGGGPPAVAAVLALFARYGTPSAGNPPIQLVTRLAAELLGGTQAQRCPDAAIVEAREALFRLAAGVRRSGGGAADELERLMQGVHFAAMRVTLGELGLHEHAARAAVSALRLVGGGGAPAPAADRAYFEAGLAARKAGWPGAALVFLNRFVDLCEAIEDGGGEISSIDNSALEHSGLIAPADYVTLPHSLFASEQVREEIKEWIIATSSKYLPPEEARGSPAHPPPPC